MLWTIICWYGYSFAAVGPLGIALGVRSFFVDPGHSLWMFGEPVETQEQKIVWTMVCVVIGTLGIGFVMWHRATRRTD